MYHLAGKKKVCEMLNLCFILKQRSTFKNYRHFLEKWHFHELKHGDIRACIKLPVYKYYMHIYKYIKQWGRIALPLGVVPTDNFLIPVWLTC